jgi:hypothetical protein
MAKNIYVKEKERALFKGKERACISMNEIQSIFKFEIARYNDDYQSTVLGNYFSICKKFGFKENIHKNINEIKSEYNEYISKKSKEILKGKNKTKNLKLPEYIILVQENKIKADSIKEFNEIYKIYKEVEDKDSFMEFSKIFKNIKLINNKKDEILITISNIFKYRENWIKEINEFKLKTKNTNKALTALIEHLFCKYQINNIFTELMSDKKNSIVFIKIANGESPRKVIEDYLPHFNLTKKMIHKLNIEKTTLSFKKRIRELQLTDYQNKIIVEVLNSYKCEDFIEDEELFLDYLNYMNNQDFSMFSSSQIMPIFDYVKHIKNLYNQRGSSFEIKNNTLENLYNGMLDWHKELGKTKHDYQWEGLKFNDYIRTHEKELTAETKEVLIKELTSSNELRKEGKEMKHCVASYATNCKRGICFIFTLKVKEYNSLLIKSKATIEVRNGRVVQVKSKHNQDVTKSNMNYIEEWKKENSIE